MRFINNLTHTKGDWAGKKFDLRDWQENKIIRPAFGLLKPNGKRLIRTVYVEIGRKNGKSELAAAVALKLLCADGEQGGEVYSAATDKDQASIVFNVAAQMVRNSPVLSSKCKIIDSQKRIVYRPTNSFYRALSSEAFSKHGLNASGIVYDEVHAAPNRELWDVLTTSTGARTQPMVFAITTSGHDRNSLGYELHEYAEQVRDGIVEDPTFLPVLFCLPEDMDWTNREYWQLVNPALHDFRQDDEMESLFTKAKVQPSTENTFRQLYLCQWTEQAVRWLPLSFWDDPQNILEDATDESLLGEPCFLGIDCSSVRDLTVIAKWFPRPDGTVIVKFRWFCPKGTAEARSKASSGKANYYNWSKTQTNFHITEGNVIDFEFVKAAALEEGQLYNVQAVAIDRLFQSAWLTQELIDEGMNVVPWGQGFFQMSAPSKDFETLYCSNRIKHDGTDKVARWNIANMVIRKDPAGNIKPDKEKASQCIDGGVAIIMAGGVCNVEGISSGPGVFVA